MSNPEPLPDSDEQRIIWQEVDGKVALNPDLVARALESLARAAREHGANGVAAARRDFLRISVAALEIARLTTN